jgi:hypothetical protein
MNLRNFRHGKYVYYSLLFNEFILSNKIGPSKRAALYITNNKGWDYKLCDLVYIGEL